MEYPKNSTFSLPILSAKIPAGMPIIVCATFRERLDYEKYKDLLKGLLLKPKDLLSKHMTIQKYHV